METEEEMEEVMMFEAREIDLDYEFDAAMFFDFTRQEALQEARAAELWFDSAGSYPPSPFVEKLVMREEIINAFMKSENVGNAVVTLESDDESWDRMGPGLSSTEMDHRGTYRENLNNANHANMLKASKQPHGGFTSNCNQDTHKLKMKAKLQFPRTSTLMKPTASVLAKQNQPAQFGGSRFQMPPVQTERSFGHNSAFESQATKRQKLEGGRLRKLGDMKLQTDFIHKPPNMNGTFDRSSVHPKLRLTIPKEPELETAHRAERMRPKNSTELDLVTVTTRRFKARPLNRKILEAPSLPLPKKSTPRMPEFQEFHLKTLERAMQQTSAVSSSSFPCTDPDKVLDKRSTNPFAENRKTETTRPTTMDAQKQDRCSTLHVFKANQMHKKLSSNKGDVCVYRNGNCDTTTPMMRPMRGWKFDKEKKIQQNLPIDLFSKLSLTSELHSKNEAQVHWTQPSCIAVKGSKENRLKLLQTEHKKINLTKERPPSFGGKPNQAASNGCMNEIGNQLNTRNLGIR